MWTFPSVYIAGPVIFVPSGLSDPSWNRWPNTKNNLWQLCEIKMGGDRRWKDGETPNLWYRIAEQVWGGGEGADEIGDGEATRRGGDGSGSQGEEKQHSWFPGQWTGTPYNLLIGAWLCWRTAWMVPWTKVTWFSATLVYFLVWFCAINNEFQGLQTLLLFHCPCCRILNY